MSRSQAQGRSLFTASAWLMAATAVLNLAMVAYHRVMSSSLGDAYAQLAALTGVVNTASVVTNGLNTWLTKTLARDAALRGEAGLKGHLLRMLPGLGAALLVLALVLALTGPWVVAYLKLPGLALYGLGMGLVLTGLMLAVLRSALQGLHRFGWLGLSLMGDGVGRVGFAWALVAQGWGAAGAFLGSLLATGLAAAAALPPLLRLPKAAEPAPPPRGQAKRRQRLLDLGLDTAALGLFSLLCFLDIFMAKHHLAVEQAALYSRVALVGKSFLYAGTALVMVLLPAVASARAKGADPRPLLLKFLGVHLALLLGGLAFVWAFTPLVIGLLCGSDPAFAALAPEVRRCSMAVIPLALFQLALLYHLAVGQRWVLAILAVTVVGYALSLEAWHRDLWDLIHALGVSSLFALLSGSALAAFRPPKSGMHEEEALALAISDAP